MRLELARGSSCKRYRARTIALEVTQDLPSGIVARRTGDAASRMASRTAQIETRDRTSIIRVTQHRTRREDLPQIERSVENIAADKSECSLKVERGKDLPRQHRAPKVRRSFQAVNVIVARSIGLALTALFASIQPADEVFGTHTSRVSSQLCRSEVTSNCHGRMSERKGDAAYPDNWDGTTAVTTPERSAATTCSIFIDSSTSNGCPTCTASPPPTSTETTVP